MTHEEQATLNEPMFQFFKYSHLPEVLQKVSKPFCDLALLIIDTLPKKPERTAALRKLLEAKDFAVRAEIYLFPVPFDAVTKPLTT